MKVASFRAEIVIELLPQIGSIYKVTFSFKKVRKFQAYEDFNNRIQLRIHKSVYSLSLWKLTK